MSSPSGAGGGVSSDPTESLTLLVVAGLAAGAAVSMGLGWLDGAVQWLVSHGVLLASSQKPLLAIPGAHGAGLDAGRLMIAASAAILLLLAAGNAVVRSHRRRKMMEEQA